MNLERVEKIANAMLYEGYILYPYRSSSVKNRQRWNFGALCPQSYSEAQGGTESCEMQTECLVSGDERAVLDVKVRFLHLLAREVGVPNADCEMRIADYSDDKLRSSISDSDFRVVESLHVGDSTFYTWQEAVEREVNLSDLGLSELVARPQRQPFSFTANQAFEPLREADGQLAGVLIRRQQLIEGVVELSAEGLSERLFKVKARILNETSWPDADASHSPPSAARHPQSRDEALLRSLVSTHTILALRGGGEFVSLLEPPEDLREIAASCRNTGTWPVMAGEEGARDCMLSSPIILYDYPQIAPESAGDLFDGTEIDEILTLRIMTLTEAEKREMRGVDERARRILERTEQLPAEELMKLHGAMRAVSPRGEDER
jgi:hydrogenase maturation protease